ncbi:MAG: TetR family transcriptional regulator, partial [Desulfobaccales bacterium]
MTTIPAEIPASNETRQRLLEAAGEVFAKKGFRNTTIREICRRARANLAAVNYHFGDKERLYLAVLV